MSEELSLSDYSTKRREVHLIMQKIRASTRAWKWYIIDSPLSSLHKFQEVGIWLVMMGGDEDDDDDGSGDGGHDGGNDWWW